MSMSRQDFVRIADTLGTVWGEIEAEFGIGQRPNTNGEAGEAVYSAMNALMERMTQVLAVGNPRFDRSKWRTYVRDVRDAAHDRTAAYHDENG